MATDQNGNYYIDPNDFDDMESVQERYAERQKQAQIDNYIDQSQKTQSDGNMMNEILREAMQEEGLTEQDYADLWANHPEAKHAAAQRIKGFAAELGKIKSRARDKDGRFISNAEAAKQGRPQPKVRQPEQKAKPKLEDLKVKAKSGYLSDSDEMAVIDALLGDVSLLD